MIDLCAAAPRRNVSANFATYTGFKSACDTYEWARIDFIFGGNLGWWVVVILKHRMYDASTHNLLSRTAVDRYKVGTSLSDDGLLASDHRPVFADVSF
jgi:hypothetical protein